MKMKRLFMILAAMLLVSIGAFAQSESTLKGDVNGDGRVDVEDVTSLVDLILSGKTYGYFYFGTTQPTAENYQMLPRVVASYISIGDAIGATASIDAGQTLYMLCPAAWMKGKKVILEDGTGSTYNFIEGIDAVTIPGYVIYRTQAWEEATDLTLNFEITGGDEYFWYAGQTQPSSMNSNPEVDDENFTNNTWHTLGTVLPNTINQKVTGGTAGNEWFVVTPKDQYVPTASDLSTVDGSQRVIDIITIGTEEYDVWSTGIETKSCGVWMKKQ